MRSRKLYHLLELMGPEDRARFTSYLDSPYFNTSRTLRHFWARWQACMVDLPENVEVTPEEFVVGTRLKRSRIDKLCSQLYLQACAFLSTEQMATQPVLQERMFADAILARDPNLNAYHRFVPEIPESLRTEGDSPEKFLALLNDRSALTIARIRARKTDIDWEGEFAEMLRLLRAYAESKALQLQCGAINAGHVFRPKNNAMEVASGARESLAAEPADDHVLARIYFQTLALQLGDDDSANFRKLLAALETHRDAIAGHVMFDVYGYVLNYCIRQINLGNPAFLRHTFDLYAFLLKKGDLLQEGKLPPQQFKNIIALACRLGNLEWVRRFIDDFSAQLTNDHGGLARRYNEAVLAFHAGRFTDAIVDLKAMIAEGAEDIFYGLDARIYLWKSYFEKFWELSPTEVDEMYRLYDAFRLYVDRNARISPAHKVQYRNFVRLFKRFVRIVEEPDHGTQLREFQAELTAATDVANKSWFREKVEEAIGRA